MKTLLLKTERKLLGLSLAAALGFAADQARADLEVSATVQIHATAEFTEPLAAHGAWIEVRSYGRCWRPAGVSVEWRPYCYGHWVWTDCGWYWASDEPWAWACYHYGWWGYEPEYGWFWVPGVEWAPAWVSWRVGGGYIGWAPLPPHGLRIEGPQFVFVQEARFSDPLQPRAVVINNPTIFSRTTVVNNMKRETRSFEGGTSRRVVVNEGPGPTVVEKASGRKLRQITIQEAARQTAAPTRLSAPAQPAQGVHGGPGEGPRGQGFTRPAPPGKPGEHGEGKGHEHEHGGEGKDHGNGKDHN